jgi:hypothetical protein
MPRRNLRSIGPYATTSTIPDRPGYAVVVDMITFARSYDYTSAEAAQLREWLTIRAAGYPPERREPRFRGGA